MLRKMLIFWTPLQRKFPTLSLFNTECDTGLKSSWNAYDERKHVLFRYAVLCSCKHLNELF